MHRNELNDIQRAGIEMLTDIMTTGYRIDVTPDEDENTFIARPPVFELVRCRDDYVEGSSTNWSGTKWEGMNRAKAREIAFDIIVGSYMSTCDEVKEAKRRYENCKLGFEKCTHLSFNFPNNWDDDKIKNFIVRFRATTWSCLHRAKFIVEFYGKTGNYNPHIHVWLPYIQPGKIKQLAQRKFGAECNVWVEPGHKNLKPYIEGVKRESKEMALELDKVYRLEHGYEDYYEFT